MKQTRLIMGMPITVEINDDYVTLAIFEKVFRYFRYIDGKFSTYKQTSEIEKINQGKLKEKDYSQDMKKVLSLCEQTKKETNGYFNIEKKGKIDASGLVKGWSIYNVVKMLEEEGFANFYVEAGGDIEVRGLNKNGIQWQVGIRNPFNRNEIVKVIALHNQGIATSGTYIRGQHIYDPHHKDKKITEIISLTVIGPNIYEADRFATAAFAMGKNGIKFIEKLNGFEGYLIDTKGMATFTSGFNAYVYKNRTNYRFVSQ